MSVFKFREDMADIYFTFQKLFLSCTCPRVLSTGYVTAWML